MTTQRESSSQGSTGTGTAPQGQQGAPAGAVPGQQQYDQPYPPEAAQAYGPGPGGYGAYQAGPDPRLAEPWRRFVGWLIDALIIGVVSAAIWIPASIAMAHRINNFVNLYPTSNTPGAGPAGAHLAGQIAGIFFLTLAAAVVLDVLYYWLLTGLWGTTVGKRAVSTWVVSTASWQKAGMGAAFLRALIFVVGPAIFGIFFLVDNIWLLFDRQRQCLHDKAAGTIVVKSEAIGR